jgi:hypothetical protein
LTRSVRKYISHRAIEGLRYAPEYNLAKAVHMNRADFVAADGQSWWLCETQTDYRIEEALKELGTDLGFSENDWFTNADRRTTLYDQLESHGSQPLNDLDSLANDDARLQWVQSVISLIAPPPAAPETDTTASAQPAPAETPPAAPASAPAKKSAFKPKAAADTTAPGQTADGAGTNGDAAQPEAPQLDQAIQSVLADVTGGGLASLAQDLGVEAEELEDVVNHPDFEREVREEVARMTAG